MQTKFSHEFSAVFNSLASKHLQHVSIWVEELSSFLHSCVQQPSLQASAAYFHVGGRIVLFPVFCLQTTANLSVFEL